MSVKARFERKESTFKTQSRHLLATARAIVITTTRISGTAIENVMTEKDPKGHAFSGPRHPSTLIGTYQEAVFTAAQEPMRTNQSETRRDQNIASGIEKKIETTIKIADGIAKGIDLTRGCGIEIVIVEGIGSEVGVPIEETKTTGLATVARKAIVETAKDDDLQYQLIGTYLGGNSFRKVKVAVVYQCGLQRPQIINLLE